MTPRGLFQVIVASIAVLGFCYGALELVDGLLYSFGLAQLVHTDPKYYAFRGVIEMVLSMLLLRGVPPFVEMAFPKEDKQTPANPDKKEETNADPK